MSSGFFGSGSATETIFPYVGLGPLIAGAGFVVAFGFEGAKRSWEGGSFAIEAAPLGVATALLFSLAATLTVATVIVRGGVRIAAGGATANSGEREGFAPAAGIYRAKKLANF